MEIKNYTLIREEHIEEIKGTAYTFLHNKTKAQICYLSCPEDDNKVFYIAFKTLPIDDKGIPHILEHCVLNGSRKFPVKEPFVELLKGSLNTFVNAMTYNDKTVFPVASRNSKDFRNLVDVYLDAVFYPNLRSDPFIMKQEGWHYEMTDPEGPITYKGVVFNEMKGAYSDPERSVELDIARNLFPDTIYGNESGGYPAAIPELSYEEFCAFHERYYHPSNSRIFFYGDGNVEEHLAFLDEEYLSAFEYRDPDSEIAEQKPFAEPKFYTGHYASADGGEDKTYLNYTVVLPKITTAEEYFAAEILMDLLAGASDAPIRKALQAEEIGADVFAYPDLGVQQPVFYFGAKDAKASQAERFLAIIREETAKACENGFDRKLLEGIFNSTEFSLKEGDFGRSPKGLALGLSMLETWLYGSEPTLLLKYNEVFASLRRKASEGYFEALAQKYILDNPFALMSVTLPDTTLAARLQQEEDSKLSAYRDSLSPEARQALCEETKAMIERQGTPDSPEALETIPLLTRDDLDKKAEQLPLQVGRAADRPFYYYPVFTNGIAYTGFYFELDCLCEEELPYAGLLAQVMTQIGTEKYSHTELDNELHIYTGGMDTDVEVFVNSSDTDSYKAFFSISARYLTEYEKEAMELMSEVLLRSDLSDTKRLKEIIAETRSGMESGLIRRGHSVALKRAMAHIAAPYALQEQTEGISYYLFLKDLEKNFEEKAEELSERLSSVAGKLINRSTVNALVTADEEQIAVTKAAVEAFEEALPAAESKKTLSVAVLKGNEALLTSGQVQYVAKAGRFTKPFRGSMEVFGSVLSLDYMWTNIRVKGGAYGSTKIISRNGLAGMASYRDPNLTETLAVFDNTASEMKEFSCSDRELLKYIIGTISNLSSPLSPYLKGAMAFRRYMCATSQATVQRVWDEVLSATLSQIRADAEIFHEAMSRGAVCVLGSRERLKAEKDLFDTFVELM